MLLENDIISESFKIYQIQFYYCCCCDEKFVRNCFIDFFSVYMRRQISFVILFQTQMLPTASYFTKNEFENQQFRKKFTYPTLSYFASLDEHFYIVPTSYDSNCLNGETREFFRTFTKTKRITTTHSKYTEYWFARF